MRIETWDLLRAEETYIVHQCNCVTNKASGLAYKVFEKYPYSNTYKDRKVPTIPGTIDICGNGEKYRYVINMYAQYYPGKAAIGYNLKDTETERLEYFKKCLSEITLKVKDGESIAMPYGIGCGLAAGNWTIYEQVLRDWDIKDLEPKNVDLVLYKYSNMIRLFGDQLEKNGIL